MVEKNNKKTMQMGLGINFILMIFVVLCMMIISLMSYREAYQKEEITNRQRQFQQAYTVADANMQYFLHEMTLSANHDLQMLTKEDRFIKLKKTLQIDAAIKNEGLELKNKITEEQILVVNVYLLNGQFLVDSYQVKESRE